MNFRFWDEDGLSDTINRLNTMKSTRLFTKREKKYWRGPWLRFSSIGPNFAESLRLEMTEGSGDSNPADTQIRILTEGNEGNQ